MKVFEPMKMNSRVDVIKREEIIEWWIRALMAEKEYGRQLTV